MVDQGRSLERLRNRWRFAGMLECVSAVRVGGGDGIGLASDSMTIRDAAGRPFLPASTLKGALRATVDRLAPVVGADHGVTSCGLSPRSERCPSPPGSPAHEAVEEALRAFSGTEREREEQLLRLLEERLCSTCRLFGSPWLAGRVFLADALPLDGDPPVEIRDGVPVDRDSGVAREQSRYSFEVVPSSTRFGFRLDGENLDDADLALLAVGLSELQRGAVRVGGAAGRGLGDCRLTLDHVSSMDFTSAAPAAVLAYLRERDMQTHAPAEWLEQALAWLVADRNDPQGAQATAE